MPRVSRLQNRRRDTMLTTSDQIQQLRAELNGCGFTPRERRQAEAELNRLIAEQAELDPHSINRSKTSMSTGGKSCAKF
jgi:hypothetical protein